MSFTRDMMPAWELRAALDASEAEITRLRAEVAKLDSELTDAVTDLSGARQDNASLAEPWKVVNPLRAENERLRAEVERLQEALTPSGATKAAYIGEFHFTDSYIGEDGNDVVRKVAVPWTTVKEIMVAIRARAALTAQEKTDG